MLQTSLWQHIVASVWIGWRFDQLRLGIFLRLTIETSQFLQMEYGKELSVSKSAGNTLKLFYDQEILDRFLESFQVAIHP